MTGDQFTALLAERLMGWRVGPERFLKGERRWTPRWQFQPLRRLEQALQLLERANGQYTLTKAADGTYTAQVAVGDQAGSAAGKSEAATITLALARALGIQVDSPEDLV
jgi:hypothetical protein